MCQAYMEHTILVGKLVINTKEGKTKQIRWILCLGQEDQDDSWNVDPSAAGSAVGTECR